MFRTEGLTLATTILAYVLAMVVLMPQYLTDTVPLVMAVYWAYEAADFSFVIERFKSVIEPAVYGGLIALLTWTWTRQHTILALAVAGYSVSYFVQAKGFVYHAYPVLVCAGTLLGVCLAAGIKRALTAVETSRSSLRWALVSALVLIAAVPVKHAHDDVVAWYVQHNRYWGNTGQFRQAVIDLVNGVAPSRPSYFFALSTHPFPGFPTASYTVADWSGRAASQFIVPAYARLGEVRDAELRDKVEHAAERQRRMIVEDFRRRPPSIVFVERARQRLGLRGQPFDDLAFYLEDPDFEEIWRSYDEHRPLGPLRVFIRRTDRVEGMPP
jgi:hypothetical protein